MTLHRVNGIDIHVDMHGSGAPILLLHGFTGSSRSWIGVSQRLGHGWGTVGIDIIGHGSTSAPGDPERYRIETFVDDLVTLLDQLLLERVHVLGYSMGGRVALHLAIAAPERVQSLILESSAPGISDPEARARRQASDEELARMIERDGLEAFVDYWESIPLFASQRQLPEEIRRQVRQGRLNQRPGGIANSLRGMGAGAMTPLQDRLHEISMPSLYIAGELDTKYVETGRSLSDAVTGMEMVVIPDAGHTVHLEQPERYIATVTDFLSVQEEA